MSNQVKFEVPKRDLRVAERSPTKSGAFAVEDVAETEWCRHRTKAAADKCCRTACSQRFATEYRFAQLKTE